MNTGWWHDADGIFGTHRVHSRVPIASTGSCAICIAIGPDVTEVARYRMGHRVRR
jgi:hypothetical protein